MFKSVNPSPRCQIFSGHLGSPPICTLSCAGFTDALRNEHPDCLRHWHDHHQRGQEWQSDPHSFDDAAEMYTAEALMYVHDVYGLPWDSDTCAAAAEAGSIDCLSYAHASGCPWDSDTCTSAAGSGSLHCLAYAHEHECAWGTSVLPYAAHKGHLECLKYAHTHGCPYLPKRMMIAVVRASSIPCLAYVRDVMGCPWDPNGIESSIAFQWGDLERLQFIHTHGGMLCTQFELLCPDGETWLEADGITAERKAMCLLYVLCYGGCQVKRIWHPKVGKLALEAIQARRVAVLLSFHVAGRARVGVPLIAAAHAVVQRMPSHLVWEVICAAGLQVLE